MSNRRFPFPVLAALPLLLAGCTETKAPVPAVSDSEAPSAATTLPEEPETAPRATAPVAPVLQVIDEKQYAEILDKHRGKVVLVDFWATWCMECLELMPHTVELREKLGEQGLEVMLISLDSPQDRRETVEKLLAKNGVTFDSYISRYGSDPKSAEVFAIESAALPNVKLYDRTGSVRKVFSAGRMPPEPFDAEDVEKAVHELLAEE
ncbi:MAG: redoxin domain-containing protein [Planctomycetaceae bacterium]|nr:redoxin domain-containing protein [Planctomycetaceae bacterium]